jgi:hypothetical protein
VVGLGISTAPERNQRIPVKGVLFRPRFLPGGLRMFGGSCGEVVAPVSTGVGDPADCGVDVEAEEVSEDRGGQVAGECGERAVAGWPGADAVPVEQVGEAVPIDGLPGNAAGEQPPGCVRAVRDYERGRRPGGQAAQLNTEC